MAANIDVFDDAKAFLAFDDQDAANLRALAPVFASAGPGITDEFYERLAQHEETANMIEGRVEALKATHTRWMMELFNGEYAEDYFNDRMKIGMAHVRIGLGPHWVEAVMSFLRAASVDAIATAFPNVDEQQAHYKSLCKILDLDLLIINQAYGEERIDRLTNFTGLSRKLIERCIAKG